MAIQTKSAMSVAEYLEWEERQEIKHEFIDGEVYTMSGVIWEHNAIVSNINESLVLQLQGSECRVNSSDMRLQISPSRYVYADLSVHCGRPELSGSRLNLLNPVFVVEVLSPSSEIRDIIDKQQYYFSVPSIQAYLIVHQERIHALLCLRSQTGWNESVFSNPNSVIPLDALDCELPLEQVYRGIQFEEV